MAYSLPLSLPRPPLRRLLLPRPASALSPRPTLPPPTTLCPLSPDLLGMPPPRHPSALSPPTCLCTSLISNSEMQRVRGGGSDASSKGVLSKMLDKGAEELLRSEGNRGLVEELERAEKRVQNARNELAEIERQEREAANLKDYFRKLEIRASECTEIFVSDLSVPSKFKQYRDSSSRSKSS